MKGVALNSPECGCCGQREVCDDDCDSRDVGQRYWSLLSGLRWRYNWPVFVTYNGKKQSFQVWCRGQVIARDPVEIQAMKDAMKFADSDQIESRQRAMGVTLP